MYEIHRQDRFMRVEGQDINYYMARGWVLYGPVVVDDNDVISAFMVREWWHIEDHLEEYYSDLELMEESADDS